MDGAGNGFAHQLRIGDGHDGFLSLFGMYEANGNPTMARGGFVELRGTKGTLYTSERTIEIVPELTGF